MGEKFLIRVQWFTQNKMLIPVLSTLAIATTVGTAILWRFCHRKIKLPVLDIHKWWGEGTQPDVVDTSIKPYRIEFTDEQINDLKTRLARRRVFTKNLEGIKSEYGINIPFLEKILKHWTETYNFKHRAELLNRFSHYKTRVQGLNIHFIRAKPENDQGVRVLPLLMLHGWPSSSKEFVHVIPELTAPRKGYDFVFEVIAPDLPGFGFSEGTTKVGLNCIEIAIIMRNLMLAIGFQKFYVHAGDWGSQCATNMAIIFPEEVLGFHSTMAVSSMISSNLKYLLGSLCPRLVFTGDEIKHANRIYPVKNYIKYLLRESGYFHLQATKPDTVGVALTDSPAGLAAYLVEKLAVCTNRDQLDTEHGGIAGLELDDVLDTVTITWMSNCVVTSMRMYAEGLSPWSPEIFTLIKMPVKVPTAATKFKHEVVYQPDWILRDKFTNLVRSTVYEFGGHFAALQTPSELTDDIFKSTVEFIKFNNKK